MIDVRRVPTQQNAMSFIVWRFPFWRAMLAGNYLLAIAGLAFLAVGAARQAFLAYDLQIGLWVSSLHFPGMDPLLAAINFVTDAHPAVASWLIATAFFTLRGRPLEALAVFSIPGVWIVGEGISRLVGSTFPSGHTTHAVTFYGLLAFIALKNVRSGSLRLAAPVAVVVVVALTSLGRVYVGDHWPSDILGSYLLGFIGLVTIASVYSAVKEDRLHLPFRRKKEPAPSPTGVTIARSIASTVYLDPRAGTATKEYNPPFLVRILYWLAFQAPFPYRYRREALEAAAAKRTIAGLLTRHQFDHDMVAPVLEVQSGASGYKLETRFVPGTSPRSNQEIEGTLSALYYYFQEVGLPTWQIAPGNPHAYSNFIRTSEGRLKLIDLESTLINVSPPWRQLLSSLRDGRFPAFDDVDYRRLQAYMEANAPELVLSLGSPGFDELVRAIETAQQADQAWKESEPRLWGRITAWVYRRLDMSRVINKVRSRLDGAEEMATSFLQAAVDRWEREGRFDGGRLASLEQMLSTSAPRTLLRHLGAHLALSVALRFPFGSAARLAWTVAFRVRARMDFAQGKITRSDLNLARSVHSVPVMLLSLVPGLGAIAYFASSAMVQSGLARMVFDQMAYKLPFRLYDRLHLACVTAPRPVQRAV